MYEEISVPEGTEDQPEESQPPQGLQLKLNQNELRRLATRIREDFANALNDHQRRMNRFLRHYRSWRARVGMFGGEQGAANFHVPLIKWQIFAKWAKEVDALLGDDAEIVSVPTAPADEKNVAKTGRYMTWRVFCSMQIVTPLIIFLFHKLLFGRSFAYSPYKRETYEIPGEGEQVDFEGPGFEPIWPDNIIVPAEDAQTVHDFSFVIRRYRATPQELLDGEEAGLYQGIEKNWEKIYQASLNGQQRDSQTDELTVMRDNAEGVLRDNAQSPRESLEIWEWYGKWRLPKGKQDAREDNFQRRSKRESELVVRFIPDLELVIGVQDLAELYPRTRRRRPIVESSLIKDGSYWCPSVPELLEDVELELTMNHNLATEAGERSIGPLIFYKPGSGFDPKTFRYEPGLAIPSDDPNAVKAISLQADLNYPVMREQGLIAIAERVTGITDQNIGRAIDRPNAPRTARGQIALLDEGSIRVNLDNRVVREDLRLILQHIWAIDSMYSGPEIFFRVTEEQAGGLFDTKDGFAPMSAEERNGKFDFDLKFATSQQSREANKDRKLALFQAAFNTPLIQQDARAQWMLLDDLFKSFGNSNLAKYLPRPGSPNLPMDPIEEWNLALQGEDFHVNEMDDDQAHIESHQQRLADENKKEPQKRDSDAEHRMIAHIMEHQEQLAQKQMMQQAATAMGQALAPLASAGGSGIAQSGGGGLDLSALLSGATGQQEQPI